MLSKNLEYTGQRSYFLNIALPMRGVPASATASRSKKCLPSNEQNDRPSCHTRPSLAASVVLANQRSSIPPRFAPYAYRSPVTSLIRRPGCKNDRGTHVGVRRNKPLPLSRARSSTLATLSDLTTFG